MELIIFFLAQIGTVLMKGDTLMGGRESGSNFHPEAGAGGSHKAMCRLVLIFVL